MLAGDGSLDVELKESGCSFRFNYAEVYWNSRLSMEHGRLVDLVGKEEVVCDVMAGVGPFAVPLAKKGCTVHANDLNPACVKYLRLNAARNRVAERLEAHNMDGRDFLRKMVEDGVVFHRALMNLPATALTFLDVFRGLWAHRAGDEALVLPTIHCYCFSKVGEGMHAADVLRRAGEVLGMGDIADRPGVAARIVRDVAPNKLMMCLTLPLPRDVAVAPPGRPCTVRPADAAGPPAKRARA